MPSVRLTVLPFPSVPTKVASRDALTFCAILLRAKSQVTVFQALVPAARRGRQLHRRCALGAEAAFVDRAVGVAFDLKELDFAIAGLARVGDQGAADGAVGADR